MPDIRTLDGVGDVRARLFAKKNIHTVEDLLSFFPRAYEDRTVEKQIFDCADGETVCIRAAVFSPVRETRIRKDMVIDSMQVSDESGMLKVFWYNSRFLKGKFRTGEEYIFYGTVKKNGTKREMAHPVFEKPGEQKETGRIVPVYPLWDRMTQGIMRKMMQQALSCCTLSEWIPKEILKKYQLMEKNRAARQMHAPEDAGLQEEARRRFAFEELLLLQLTLFRTKKQSEKLKKAPYPNRTCAWEMRFPFTLTNAQRHVIEEILEDFGKSTPMNRLVQGDVGSGKTAVAAAAMYVAARNGEQSALMAPTEILAKQHYETFCALFCNTPFRVCLLTGGTKKKPELYKKIQNGEFDLVIGTHAVIQKSVQFQKLGLVIADEQHRFGVKQRAALSDKGEHPHFLVMSATPIPRTLALILYGDLQVSIIDELPPNRKPIQTYAVGEHMRSRVYAFIEKNVKTGTQCYVVCPLIEESEKSDLANAESRMLDLQSRFPDFRVGLVHGRMKPAEKEKIMEAFSRHELDILVSTTVIEVGVNVPNSNLMVIENAERFGLSQLHQLRGRVGRGAEQAYCILMQNGGQEVTKKRMKIMCQSNDGFYISEQDLKLRGPGDFFGTRQHGLPALKVANLFEDLEILKAAQSAAVGWLHREFLHMPEEEARVEEKIESLLSEMVVRN